MDSDSSSSDESSGRGACVDDAGGRQSHLRTAGRGWSSDRANSDVSEDENFSRGAKSIDSPPESPPRGGGNLDSPPASPAAPGLGSPAPYSGSDSSGTSPRPPESPPSYLGSPAPQAQQPRTPPEYPASPDAYGPASPVNGRSSSVDGPSSPGDARSSTHDAHSLIGSPDGGQSSNSCRDSSPTSPRGSSSVDGNSNPASPSERPTTERISRRVQSPSDGRSSAGDESQSPGRMRSAAQGSRHFAHSSPGSNSNPSSPVENPSSFPDRSATRRVLDSRNSVKQPRSPEQLLSPNESPNSMNRQLSNSGGPSTPLNRPSTPLSLDGDQSPRERYSSSRNEPLSPSSPSESHVSSSRRRASSDHSGRSPDEGPCYGRRRMERHCNPVDEDSFSPRRTEHTRRRVTKSKPFSPDEQDYYPDSPIEELSSPASRKDKYESDHQSSPVSRKRRSPASPATSDGRSNISSDSSLGGSPEPVQSKPTRTTKSPSPIRPPDKVEIKSHGEDLSDVSDIESLGTVSDSEQDKESKDVNCDFKDKESSSVTNGGTSGVGTMTLGEEAAEQLDFEAEEREEPEVQDVTSHHQPEGSNSNAKDSVASTVAPTAGQARDSCDDEEEGEVKEREDGELSDEGEVRPEETEPRPVCRFFSRGQCTWGSSCSFRHVSQSGEVVPTAQGQIPARSGNLRFIRPWLRKPGMPPVRYFAPRFVHPGVTDKGNYTMFDMVRPLVPMNNGPPPPPHLFPPGPVDVYGPRPIERPVMAPGPPPYQQPVMRREEPPGESAWERGLRQAKELLRRSTKRKETDADFEEKKMNLTLSGQDEFDKENDYYTRPTSPIYEDAAYHERYPAKEGEKRYRSVSDRFGDYPPAHPYPPYPAAHPEGWFDVRPSRFHHQSSRHHPSSYQPSGRGGNAAPPEEYYERTKRQKYSSREVIMQRSEKTQWKENSPSPPRARGSDRSGRGDEWADPWMRSKSPSRKGTGPTSRSTRKKSYSSRSTYSSSSSSHTSSCSSYSRSATRSRSTRSPSSRSRSRSSFTRKKMSPLSRRANKSPFSRGERRGQDIERAMHMNPPAPSPRANVSPTARRNPTPPESRSNRNMSARLLVAAMRDRSVSRSSRTSSNSDSSGSSSDSSSDSASSTSSSPPSPPQQQHKALPIKPQGRKKIELDEKLAQAMKVKAMDALKLSGQKQQIKLTLKGAGSGTAKERLSAPVVNRKRMADSPLDDDDNDLDSPSVTKKKPAPSRREELLKQLKAVEDAIARKRSKI